MNLVCLNFSHGDHSDHSANYHRVHAAAAHLGRPVGSRPAGTKIRLGRFADGPVLWTTGTASTSPSRTARATTTASAPPTPASPPTPTR